MALKRDNSLSLNLMRALKFIRRKKGFCRCINHILNFEKGNGGYLNVSYMKLPVYTDDIRFVTNLRFFGEFLQA